MNQTVSKIIPTSVMSSNPFAMAAHEPVKEVHFIETIFAIRSKVLAIDLPNVFCTMAAGHCKNESRV